MAISSGTDLLVRLTNDLIIFEMNWVISIIITLISLLIITRDYSRWKRLAFPVVIAWYVAGINPSLLVLVPVAIVWVIDTMSIQVITELVSATKKAIPTDLTRDLIQKEQVRQEKRYIRQKLTPDIKSRTVIGDFSLTNKKDIESLLEKAKKGR